VNHTEQCRHSERVETSTSRAYPRYWQSKARNCVPWQGCRNLKVFTRFGLFPEPAYGDATAWHCRFALHNELEMTHTRFFTLHE